VLIDPVNPDVVCVAAMGHQWTPNGERGVFKTTDGGRTWTRVLFADDRTGAIDVVVDPSNRNLLFASSGRSKRVRPRASIAAPTPAAHGRSSAAACRRD
jgi:hypothetical protein